MRKNRTYSERAQEGRHKVIDFVAKVCNDLHIDFGIQTPTIEGDDKVLDMNVMILYFSPSKEEDPEGKNLKKW